MPNHVHLILTPAEADALCRAVGETHRRYTRRINSGRGWRGYLWQPQRGPCGRAILVIRDGLRHENTGRPLGDAAFVKKLESLLGRPLTPHKPGPKPREKPKSRTTRTVKKQV